MQLEIPMQRKCEPELMNDPAQAHAYAHADFSEPHQGFVTLFAETFPDLQVYGRVLDLGCGTADVTLRFARAHPQCSVDAVDGAENMLAYARHFVAQAGLLKNIKLVHARLPDVPLARHAYDVIISNSLLHHLHQPEILWATITQHARPGAAVFIMDLQRPNTHASTLALVEKYAAHEPEILRRDFFNSLCAAFRADEIRTQLLQCGLKMLNIRTTSDRHILISGFLPS